MTARGLTEADVEGALKTYVPGGKRDDYLIFASGGHGGQVLVIGVPSMHLLKVIGVFASEPWQAYGYDGGSEAMFEQGRQFGIGVLSFKDSIEGQLELGLGPLHTVFDDKGNAYTSVSLDSAVAKWSYKEMKLLEKLPVHYNIGHIMAAEGDAVAPDGKYLVATNKMSIDRFNAVGPLYPQKFQLVDVSGDKMKILSDTPVGIGEPHYSQMSKADKLKPIKMYKVGTNTYTGGIDPNATEAGKERIERKDGCVHVSMTAIRSHFTPDQIDVGQGEKICLHVTALEQSEDQVHGFALNMHQRGLNKGCVPIFSMPACRSAPQSSNPCSSQRSPAPRSPWGKRLRTLDSWCTRQNLLCRADPPWPAPAGTAPAGPAAGAGTG